ncbi:MAG: hypothetical protein ACWIPI_06475 [Polaribacter sp.]
MKKVFLVFVILLANSVFTSCTDLNKNLENEKLNNETVKAKVSDTGGEDGQLPDYDVD